MGGPGSGGARAGAGRLRLAERAVCAFCARAFTTYRRNRKFCDDHRRPRDRAGDRLRLVLDQAVMRMRSFERQFQAFADVASIGRAARAQLEQLLEARIANSATGFRSRFDAWSTAQEPSLATAQDSAGAADSRARRDEAALGATTQEPD